ncbi:MAG: hypothetical protein CK527_06120 [Nitrosarchaeum sp.]|nr:hypothetical protein [Nitrosarchaeum sp.]MBP0133906.1 hypothetical protein [Nitrosarchaeum sp.]PHY08505.1 MAG: hypothetical protein CK527_06120 [Nitrosarchaeum sp.]
MDLYKAKYSDKKFDRHSKSNTTSSRKSNEDNSIRSYRNTRDERKPEMHTVTCYDCGNECKIPFEPKFNRPVYCSECFQKNNPRESRDKYSKDDRPSRDKYSKDDRPSRDKYSKDDSSSKTNQDNYKTSKFTSKKSQSKTDNFYSNGSEKFYSSLKEKLFEILGGKLCSNCGFNDERALGFNHISDVDAFDSIRRGGFASSWGKYISEPELARKDLRVLCLNCNEIRDFPTKTEPQKPKIFYKKSRYFPS